MKKMQYEQLEEIGKRIYSEDEFEFSKQLFKAAEDFNLEINTQYAAFFMKAELASELKKFLENEISPDIIKKIELLQRISNISFPERKRHIMNLRNLFIQITDDLSVIFLILIERLVTLQNQDKINHPELHKTAEECLFLYAPIAQRLGISKIYNPMEDIAFRIIYPDEFIKLNNAIESKRKYFLKKLSAMAYDVNELMAKNKIPVKLQSRVKRPYSVHRKIHNKSVSLDEIYDLLALRVITDNSANCYQALGLVHSNWNPVQGRFRDWITFPKKNGYRSIQTTVETRKGEKYEIQIRTEQMHREAEYGSAAHWSYKQGGAGADVWVNRLKEFLSNDEYFDKPEEVFEKLKSEINRDKIFILTPKGEIIGIKKDSTPIDFAFAVHTDLGYKINGARVNGKFAKLNTKLQSGDVVQIISSNNSTPSRDWLEFVQSPRAKSKIQRWFKHNERQLFINDGKKTYDKLRRRYKKRLEGFENEVDFSNFLKKNALAEESDFYYAIAHNHIKSGLKLLKSIYPKAFEKDKTKKKQDNIAKKIKKNSPQIKVENLKGLETKIAKCCHPVKGEPIVAYVTKREGVKIHHKNCIFLNNDGIDKDNLKKAEWLDEESMQIVKIKIFGNNYSKMLDTFTDEVSERAISVILKDKVNAGKGVECIYTELEVKDIEQLNSLISKLNSTNYITGVKKV